MNQQDTLFIYLFILQFFMSTLHVSKDRAVHHQQLIVVYCITQLCKIVLQGDKQ